MPAAMYLYICLKAANKDMYVGLTDYSLILIISFKANEVDFTIKLPYLWIS